MACKCITGDKMGDKIFINCEKCGKRLIERLPNGLFRFLYGKSSKHSLDMTPAVEIVIKGNVEIKCLSRKCKHVNKLSYLPNIGT